MRLRIPNRAPVAWPASLLLILPACSSASPAPTGAEPEPTTSTRPAATSTTTSTSTTGTPTAGPWPGEAPDVLLATEEGIFLGDSQVAAADPIVAVDDLEGGIVFQAVGDSDERSGQTWWLRPGSGDPLPIGESPGFPGLLHQVAEVEGRPHLVVTRRLEGGEPEEHLELYELAPDPEAGRRLLQVGGIEWGAQSVSYGAGRFLVTEIDHSCGALYLVDLSGTKVAAPGLPEAPCLVHFEVPFLHGRLSPDGSLLAYVAQVFEFDDRLGHPVVVRSDLVVQLETGEEVLRERVTDAPTETVASMDFDGEWVVWALSASDGSRQWPPVGKEVLGLHLDGARFRAEVRGVRWVWIPKAPFQL